MSEQKPSSKKQPGQCARCSAAFAYYPSQGPGKYCSRKCKRLHYAEHPELTAKFIDLTGQTFGRLTVLSFDGHIHGKHVAWLVECSCPDKTRFRVAAQALRTGSTRSCGCINKGIGIPKPDKKICNLCGRELPFTAEFFRKGGARFRWGLRPQCRECSGPILRKRHLAWRRNLKRVVLTHYSKNGGPQCVCCGTHYIEFLTLDHINNDGKQDRMVRGIGMSFYSRLKKEGYPPGLQCLCFNCNIARALFGKCPHQD